MEPDTLVVYDPGLLRLTRFLTTGALVSTQNFEGQDGFPEIYLGRFSTGEYGFSWIRLGPRDGSQVNADVMRIARFGESGRMNALLGTETGMIRASTSPVAFSPHLYVELIRDSIFLTKLLPPEIQVWDHDGNLARTITVPAPEVNSTEAWTQLEEVLLNDANEAGLY